MFNVEDYKLVKGTHKCEGCALDDNGDCMIGWETPHTQVFPDCWGLTDMEWNEENGYFIFAKK